MHLKKLATLSSLALFFCCAEVNSPLEAHCQMPCGIYHDDMMFDFIDQYMETMYKAVSILNESKFSTVREKNEFVRWVMLKDKQSDEAANIICTYFLQQKIKPGEEDTATKLKSAHNLLFLIVAIKQNTDLQIVKNFATEWDNFKLMFHIEGYECEMEKKNLEEIMQLRAEKEAKEKEAKSKETASRTASGTTNGIKAKGA